MARPLYEIANEIESDWARMSPAARPFVDAMASLNTIHDQYGADDAEYVVAYFLSNASSWRGAVARRVRKELNDMLKSTRRASAKTALSYSQWERRVLQDIMALTGADPDAVEISNESSNIKGEGPATLVRVDFDEVAEGMEPLQLWESRGRALTDLVVDADLGNRWYSFWVVGDPTQQRRAGADPNRVLSAWRAKQAGLFGVFFREGPGARRHLALVSSYREAVELKALMEALRDEDYDSTAWAGLERRIEEDVELGPSHARIRDKGSYMLPDGRDVDVINRHPVDL